MIVSIPALQRFAPHLAPRQPQRANPFTDKGMTHCPECQGPLLHASGCLACPGCGWGKCG